MSRATRWYAASCAARTRAALAGVPLCLFRGRDGGPFQAGAALFGVFDDGRSLTMPLGAQPADVGGGLRLDHGEQVLQRHRHHRSRTRIIAATANPRMTSV